jgi:hypothetical protein
MHVIVGGCCGLLIYWFSIPVHENGPIFECHMDFFRLQSRYLKNGDDCGRFGVFHNVSTREIEKWIMGGNNADTPFPHSLCAFMKC